METKEKSMFDTEIFLDDLNRQKIEWRKKAWSIPDLRGSKYDWFALTRELLNLVENGQAVELDSYPQISSISNLQTWRTYASFLKGLGLVKNHAGVLSLTEAGVAFQRQPTQGALANIIHNKVRLFGEVLAIIRYAPATVEEVDTLLRKNYNLEATAQAWFTSWFVDYEPFPHSYDEDGKPLPPDDWENGILDSCIDFYNGYAFKSDDLLDEPIPESFDVFKMGNIKKGGGLNYEGTKSWIEREFCKGLERFILIRGDILMAMTDMKENVALLGHTALMDIDDKYIVNQRVGLLRPNGFMGISPYQVYLLTNNATFLRELRRHAHIGVQVNLSKEDIVNSRVVYAPKKINQAFATKVKPLFDCISNNNAEILKLTEIASQIQSQLSR